MYHDTPSEQPKSSFDYNAYLASLHIDPQASRQLYQSIISEQEVKKQVEQALAVDQPIVLPAIPDSKLTTTNSQGQIAVKKYFDAIVAVFGGLRETSLPDAQNVFAIGTSADVIQKVIDETAGAVSQLYKIPVPTEAMAYHKAQLANLETYLDVLKLGQTYNGDDTVDPWPNVYKDYAIINEETQTVNAAFDQLDTRYHLTELYHSETVARAKGTVFIPAAQALIPVVDVKKLAEDIYQEALATAFARFATAFLDKLITSIEQNYKIANFLYYTDALVSGQYLDDYLDKYVGNNLDKAMIKNFIPELNCGNPQDMKLIFKAKADQYLGFDPTTVSPKDPEYFSKMARVGDFLSSPQGWDLYYQDVADQARAAAQQAAQDEMTSEGLKAARDVTNQGSISTAVFTSLGALRAAFVSYLDIGNANAKSLAGKIASVAVQTFLNKFVFQGAVLKEQKVCIGTPQVHPVIPGEAVSQEQAPTQPSEFDIEKYYQANP